MPASTITKITETEFCIILAEFNKTSHLEGYRGVFVTVWFSVSHDLILWVYISPSRSNIRSGQNDPIVSSWYPDNASITDPPSLPINLAEQERGHPAPGIVPLGLIKA